MPTPANIRELFVQDRLRDGLERRLVRTGSRTLVRQIRAAASAYGTGGVEGIESALVTAPQEWFAELSQLYTRSGNAFGVRLLDFLGSPEGVRSQFFQGLSGFIQSEGLTHAKGIVDTTKADLRFSILRAESEGLGREATARLLRKTAPEISINRARVIASTETHNAATFSAQEAARSTGIELKKTWITHMVRSRDSHIAADGQVRLLDEPYEVGGARLMRPGDASLGAPAEEIVNCRCGEAYEPA